MITKLFRHKLFPCAPALLAAAVAMSACNADKAEEPPYEPALSVAVTGFSLSPNARVMAHLDSVFFSIDLEHGVIFNADSLPAGTRIDKLVPQINFPAAVSKAEIEMTGGMTRTGTVNYIKSPSDSIDFTGKVRLTLATDDNELTRTYDIKVNVHKMVADSLMWDRSAFLPLPSQSAAPKSQRTVICGDKVMTIISEDNGSYTLATSTDLPANSWSVSTISVPFTPQLRSLTACGTKLYILDSDGNLHTSADAETWTPCGVKWRTLIGAFGERLLGITDVDGKLYHDTFPRPAGFILTEIPSDFPTSGLSEFHSFTSKWATEPIGLFIGGRRDTNVSNATWAYDGYSWANISNTPLPAAEGVLLLPYFNYRQTATSWIQTEFSVLLAFGGRLADGNLNRDVYLSYDNGVNWMKAQSLLQLPDYVPTVVNADALIRTSPMNADLNDRWQTRASSAPRDVKRIQYFTEGTDVSWECPYIYMFGGDTSTGILNDRIWRAVLARLTFAPLF